MTTTYTVYADILFLENLVMDFIILSAAARLVKKLFSAEAGPLRRLLGAAAGAVYAVLILCLPGKAAGVLGSLFGKAVLSLGIVYLVFRPRSVLLMLKELLIFCLTGFIFAGLSFSLTFFGFRVQASGGLLITVLPSGLSPVFLAAGLGYILLSMLTAFLKKALPGAECRVSLYIEFDGSGMWIPALIDTGNELKDPLTGTPVIIVEAAAIQSILGAEITELAAGNPAPDIPSFTDPAWARRFRMIPFRSLGCESGLLPGFKADRIRIRYGDGDEDGNGEAGPGAENFQETGENAAAGTHKERTAIICLYNKALSETHRYSALLSPELVA